ncbi:hypothetical protein NC651_017775 [Populus alba x Populus x berolinensis]|nr:hypothetical protein NC651_017775 [Populus alba x Populus x berolinensis]
MDANICIWSFEFKLIHYENADAYLKGKEQDGSDRSKPPKGKEQDGSDRSKPPEGKEQDGSARSKPPEKVVGVRF